MFCPSFHDDVRRDSKRQLRKHFIPEKYDGGELFLEYLTLSTVNTFLYKTIFMEQGTESSSQFPTFHYTKYGLCSKWKIKISLA